MSDLSRVESSSESLAFFAESAPPAADQPAAPVREGLPPNYRMRADAHYVEQLAQPAVEPLQNIEVIHIETSESLPLAVPALIESIERYGVLEPLLVQKRERRYRLISGRKRLAAAMALGLRHVPAVVHRVGDEQAEAWSRATQGAEAAKAVAPPTPPTSTSAPVVEVERQIAASLHGILTSVEVVSDAAPHLTRAVAVDMIRAEARRASCTVAAARLLRQGVPQPRRRVAPGTVVKRIVDAVSSDARLRGIVVESSISVAPSSQVSADEDSLVATLAGVVFALCGAIERGNGERLTISALTDDTDKVSFVITQEAVILPDAWLNVETPAADDGGDPMALLALRKVAEAYGGRVSASRLPHGSRVSLRLP